MRNELGLDFIFETGNESGAGRILLTKKTGSQNSKDDLSGGISMVDFTFLFRTHLTLHGIFQ
jgi:hypothetical protein